MILQYNTIQYNIIHYNTLLKTPHRGFSVTIQKHPSVTDPVESLSSPGFHWVGEIPTGSAGLFDKNMANCGKSGVLYWFSFFAVAAL